MTTQRRSTDTAPVAGEHPTPHYEIRVAGHLGPRWSAWFDGLDMSEADDGITVLRGPIVDEAALHGVLDRLRDLGISLVSLTRLPHHSPEPSPERDPK